jgi:hypothetical protein
MSLVENKRATVWYTCDHWRSDRIDRSTSVIVKVCGCRPHEGGAAHTGGRAYANLQMEETAGGVARWRVRGCGDLGYEVANAQDLFSRAQNKPVSCRARSRTKIGLPSSLKITGGGTILEWEHGYGPIGPVAALLSLLAASDHYPIDEEIISESDAAFYRAMMRAGIIRRLG